MHHVRMRASVDIDPELEKQLNQAQNLTNEKQATVIRLALRAGLPLVIDRFQAPRPEGYFDSALKYPIGFLLRARWPKQLAKDQSDEHSSMGYSEK